jgi:hypothetical protein
MAVPMCTSNAMLDCPCLLTTARVHHVHVQTLSYDACVHYTIHERHSYGCSRTSGDPHVICTHTQTFMFTSIVHVAAMNSFAHTHPHAHTYTHTCIYLSLHYSFVHTHTHICICIYTSILQYVLTCRCPTRPANDTTR